MKLKSVEPFTHSCVASVAFRLWRRLFAILNLFSSRGSSEDDMLLSNGLVTESGKHFIGKKLEAALGHGVLERQGKLEVVNAQFDERVHLLDDLLRGTNESSVEKTIN